MRRLRSSLPAAFALALAAASFTSSPAWAGWGSALLKGLEKGAVKAEAKAATKAAGHAAEHAAAYEAERAAMHEAGAVAHAHAPSPHEGGAAAHGAEHEGTSASDIAEEVAGNVPGPDGDSGDNGNGDTANHDDGYDDTGRHYEDNKHAARSATLDDLERVARETKDGPLFAQVQRIRAKEDARHAAVLRKLAHR